MKFNEDERLFQFPQKILDLKDFDETWQYSIVLCSVVYRQLFMINNNNKQVILQKDI